MDVSVAVATCNRRESLLRTLGHLTALPERPPVIVVDTASVDGTSEAARRAFPSVQVLHLRRNAAAAGRNVGVAAARTPYVAFSDDDSWWEPGALARAAELLDAYPSVGLVAARVLVGEERRLDPTCERMAASPLNGTPALPGSPVLGFVACGAVVRREAFLEVGGFNARLGLVGEDRLLAVDLASAGWACAYADDVVAHHWPAPDRDPRSRAPLAVRNELWLAWLRLGLPRALRVSLALAASAVVDGEARRGVVAGLRGLGPILGERRPAPAAVRENLDRVTAKAS